jgi:hypothetical protein
MMRALLPSSVAAAVALTATACAADAPSTPQPTLPPTTNAPATAASPPSPAPEQPPPEEDTPTAGGQAVQAEIEVKGGQVSGGVRQIQAPVGAPVELRVTSDQADIVHVHGYDLEAPVAPGEAATVTFTADIPGVFEVELEERGLKIAELEVGA